MTETNPTDPTTGTVGELTIPERLLDYSIGYLLNEHVGTLLADAKAALMAVLLEEYRRTGTKQFVSRTPDGKIATLTLTEPGDKAEITDREAFLDWVAENRPTEIETKIVVRPAFEKQLLEKRIIFVDGQAVHEPTGEIVPGVGLKPAGEPKTFSHRFDTPKATGARTEENRKDGREKLYEHLATTGRYGFLALPAAPAETA